MITLIILIVLVVSIKIIYNPKLDITEDGDVYLWYGKKDKRKYLKL